MLCQIWQFQLRNTLKLSPKKKRNFNKSTTFVFKITSFFTAFWRCLSHVYGYKKDLQPIQKSRIRETLNLSTDADRRTDTILESLRDLSRKKRRKKLGCWRVHASTRPCIHASARPHDGSTRGRWMLCTHPPFLGLHACNKMGSTRVIRWAPHQFFHAK